MYVSFVSWKKSGTSSANKISSRLGETVQSPFLGIEVHDVCFGKSR